MSALTSRVLRAISMAVMLLAARSLVGQRTDTRRVEPARRPRVPAPPAVDVGPAQAAPGHPEVAGPAAPPFRRPPLGAPAPALPGRAAAQSWVWTRRWDLCVMGAMAVVLGVVHAWGMGRYPAFFDDEGTYISQAWAIDAHQGLAPYTYWYDHPPLGWITLAGWAKVFPMFGADLHAVAAARGFMVLTFVISACLVYVIGRRLGLRRPFAAVAMLLFGLSPLAVHYQRMVLLDNIAVAWVLGAVALALCCKGRLTAYAGSGVCLAGACLTKETFVLFAPAVLLAVWQGAEGPTRRFAVAVFTTLFALVLAFYPLFAALRGELLAGPDHTSLVDGVRFQLSREGSGSLLDPDSGSRQLIDSWMSLDWLVLALGLLALPVGLYVRRFRPVALALVIPVLMALRPGTYLPAMYIIGLLPFAAILAAAAAAWLWRPGAARAWLAAGRGRRGPAPVASLGGSAAVLVVLAAVALLAIPKWSSGLANQMGTDLNRPYRDAVAWLDDNADRRSTILVDNTVWTDLVERGFEQSRVVWFYKLDLDPAVQVPWQQFDYVVATNIIMGDLDRLHRTNEVIRHSVPVVRFAAGPETVEIRRVTLEEPVRAP
jgi:hypothetical protein